MAEFEPSIPIDPDHIPEGGIALFADLDQSALIHEIDGGQAMLAIDPVKNAPAPVFMFTIRDPAAPVGFRVASIALDQDGLVRLHRRVGNLMTGRTDPQ